MASIRRSTPTQRALRRPLLVLLACALFAAIATGAAARTNDKPTAGKFTGEHAFNGTITLVFANTDGIGLHVKSYRFNGTQRCPYDEVPLNLSHRVTALTSAKVKRDGRFQLRSSPLSIQGRYVSSKRVQGKITISTAACRTSGNFAARRR